MFYRHNNADYKQSLQGIKQKTLVFGEKTLLTEFKMKKGSKVPLHHHPFEQTGYLVKGRIIFIIADKPYEAKAGDSWCIPSNAEHSADILEDSLAIEVFSPVRNDYLP